MLVLHEYILYIYCIQYIYIFPRHEYTSATAVSETDYSLRVWTYRCLLRTVINQFHASLSRIGSNSSTESIPHPGSLFHPYDLGVIFYEMKSECLKIKTLGIAATLKTTVLLFRKFSFSWYGIVMQPGKVETYTLFKTSWMMPVWSACINPHFF